jgi:ABC-2 type transport system ATP-binding protein
VLINVVTPKPGMLDEFLDVQVAEQGRLAGRVPGLRGNRLHRAADGQSAIGIAVFDTVDDHKRWVASDTFAEHLSRIEHLIERAEPAITRWFMKPEPFSRVTMSMADSLTMPLDLVDGGSQALAIAGAQGHLTAASSIQPSMQPIISVTDVSKTYATGFHALKNVNLEIRPGEIFALLGPNGAGKTTLISIVCGIVNPSSGTISADGHDIKRDYRAARAKIGLVPQELTTDAFESVWATVSFSRGLFGKSANPAFIEKVLRDLSLWDKKDAKIMTLSGGMKRRVMIAKALSHEPRILFLDEPTAGVDVELRRDMWNLVRGLRETGVTVILTTHYIEEAEEMADRIGVISHGELILVEEKAELMRKLGKKQLTLQLQAPLQSVPDSVSRFGLELSADGTELTYTYDTQAERTGITTLLSELGRPASPFGTCKPKQSSLEEIFVSLVREER